MNQKDMLETLKKADPTQVGPYLCSKWINHHFLVSIEEFKDLLDMFDTNCFFQIGKMFSNLNVDFKKELTFAYDHTLLMLKEGKIDLNTLKQSLPVAIGKSPNAFYLFSPKENIYTVKISKPVLQLQLNTFRYSFLDKTIRLNALSSDCIFWGFKLSYPQIFQNPKTNKIEKIDSTFENFAYFSQIRKWMRDKTSAVRFIIEQKKVVSTLRIGKKCLPWIHLHPQLKEIGCELDNYAH